MTGRENRAWQGVSEAMLGDIWTAQGLGTVNKIVPATGGVVNACYFVNDELVIRLNVRDPLFAKMRNEATAYRLLEKTSVPVPGFICLDESREIVSYDYLITTRLPRSNIFESRDSLNHDQKCELAWEVGRCLAMLHQITFDGFAKLWAVDNSSFSSWVEYFDDYGRRYLEPARRHELIDGETLIQLQRILERSEELFSKVTKGALVHSDYHYENILQVDGRLTGILDFEWSYSGDPAADFVPSGDREEMLPGSETFLEEGYRSVRPLPEGRHHRIELYRHFLELEMVVTYHRVGDAERLNGAKAELVRRLTEVAGMGRFRL